MSFQKPLVLIVLSLTLLSFSNCGSTKENEKSIIFQENTPFVIEGVTSQKTIAGIKEGGASTRLTVPVSQVDEGVQFKNLYYSGQMVEAKVNPVVKSQYIGFFTSVKKDFIMDSDPKKEINNTSKISYPFNLTKNEAVISYMYEGKLSYYKLTTIEELPPIALPSQNTNGGLNKL